MLSRPLECKNKNGFNSRHEEGEMTTERGPEQIEPETEFRNWISESKFRTLYTVSTLAVL